MQKLTALGGRALLGFVVCAVSVMAQGRGGPEWTTQNADAQRTGWVKTDAKISVETIEKPGFQFLWKVKFDNQPRQTDSLSEPVLIDRIIGYKGFRSLALIGGSSDNVMSLDSDLGRVEWKMHLAPTGNSASTKSSALCPGGMSMSITRPTPLTPPVPAAGRAARGAAAPGAPGAPAAPAPGGAAAVGPGRSPATGVPAANRLYVIASDGALHILNVQTGSDVEPPIPFLSAGAKTSGLITVDGVVYATTTDNCAGIANGVYALDLTKKSVTNWKTNGGNIPGAAGPAMGTDGTVYVAVGSGTYNPDAQAYASSIVALEPKTLKVKDWYAPSNWQDSAKNGADQAATPVIFQYKGKDLIAAVESDGRLVLLDSVSLGGTDHHTALSQSDAYAKPSTRSEKGTPGALASFEDTSGTRWVLAVANGPLSVTPSNGAVTNGAVVAYKVVEQDGKPTLQLGWTSRDLPSPLTPIVVNNVVFALSSGAGKLLMKTLKTDVVFQKSPAVLYALDATTGKEIWNSGNTITSFVSPSAGMSAAAGQLYVGSYDGTFWAFGFPMEH